MNGYFQQLFLRNLEEIPNVESFAGSLAASTENTVDRIDHINTLCHRLMVGHSHIPAV